MSERYDMDLVVRRVVWHAEDETETQYLDDREQWTSNASKAWLYGSPVVFMFAEMMGGEVFMRLPSGRELPVTKEDFTEPAAAPQEKPRG